MSSEKKKSKRSFSMIFKLVQVAFAMVFIFFLSFFVTIAVKTSHPIDYIRSTYFEKTSKDKIIDEYANNRSEKKSSMEVTTSKPDTPTERKPIVREKIDTSTISGKLKRLRSIKQAVDEKMLDKEHYLVLDEIPLNLRRAIVAVEDSRFYTHSGFDLSGIARAAVVNFESGQIEEGGSTITQQLVKNLFLSQEQSFTRKIEELLLAMEMEKEFSKDEILELYLNTIYFGSNFYGIYDASKGYFGVEPKDLTLAESAMLAGLPNAPSLYSPYVDFMLAKKRQLIVLDAMVKASILTKSEAEKAKIATIILAKE